MLLNRNLKLLTRLYLCVVGTIFNDGLASAWNTLDQFSTSALGYVGPCFLNTCSKFVVVSVFALFDLVFNIERFSIELRPRLSTGQLRITIVSDDYHIFTKLHV